MSEKIWHIVDREFFMMVEENEEGYLDGMVRIFMRDDLHDFKIIPCFGPELRSYACDLDFMFDSDEITTIIKEFDLNETRWLIFKCQMSVKIDQKETVHANRWKEE